MSMLGMNIDEVLRAARELDQQAARLGETSRALDRIISVAGQHWRGADIDQFRRKWTTQYRRASLTAAQDLTTLADTARRNAEAQRATSDTLEGGPGTSGGHPFGPGLGGPATFPGLDWLGERVGEGLSWAGDRLEDGWNWAGDRVDDVVDFVQPRLDAAIPALQRMGQAEFTRLSQYTRMFTEGRIPQASELLASDFLLGGTTAGLIWNAITGEDQHLFDPGTPSAGTPTPMPAEDAPAVGDFTGLTNAGLNVYHTDPDQQGIRVDTIRGADGVDRYLIAVPGTESKNGVLSLDSYLENTNARNWTANLWSVAQGSSATNTQAVRMAIEAAGVPEGAEILFTTHSQGGIIVTNLIADEEFSSTYQIQGAVSMGAPIDCADLPRTSEVPILSIVHGNKIDLLHGEYQLGDIVPQVDLGGAYDLNRLGADLPLTGRFLVPSTNPSISEITLPPRGDSVIDVPANHDQSGYEQSLTNLTPAQQAQVRAFEQRADLQNFYANPGTGNVQTGSVRVATYGAAK